MRTRLNPRPALVPGALGVAITGSAFALGAGHPKAKSAPIAAVKPVAYVEPEPRLVVLSARPLEVLGGHAVRIRGRVIPAQAGRPVVLQAWGDRGWRPLAAAVSGAEGYFRVRYLAASLGAQRLRVRSADSVALLAPITVFQETVASWYDDAGSTACGFHATMGVANKTLPCGTRVTFRLGGRMVTATVDDRGPFVPGRDWDLNQNVAGALGVEGVATVWSSA